MRSSWIITIAALCGVAVFVYTLAVGSTGRRNRDWRRGMSSNVMTNTRQASPLPETVEGLEEFTRNNARSGRAYFALARRYDEADRPDDARSAWEKAAELRLAATVRSPENPDLWFEAGWSLWKLGRLDEARQPFMEAEHRYRSAPAANRTDAAWHRLGWCRKLLGQDQDAMIAWARAKEALLEFPDGWAGGRFYDLACYHALLGETGAALTSLEKAVAADWTDADRAMHDEDLESIRDEPRFLEVVRKMRERPSGVRVEPG
jgi:tetratricopeptide (TPR) repeat protein